MVRKAREAIPCSIRLGLLSLCRLSCFGRVLRGSSIFLVVWRWALCLRGLASSRGIPVLAGREGVLTAVTGEEEVVLTDPGADFGTPEVVLGVRLDVSGVAIPATPVALLVVVDLLSASVPLRILRRLRHPWRLL